jgi:hypothetical protein
MSINQAAFKVKHTYQFCVQAHITTTHYLPPKDTFMGVASYTQSVYFFDLVEISSKVICFGHVTLRYVMLDKFMFGYVRLS